MRLVLALTALTLAAGLGSPGVAQTAPSPQAEASDVDRAQFRRAIEGQIDALRAGDASRAFSFASPGIQARFGNPATFLSMVEGGYAALIDPQGVAFGAVTDALGYPTQIATVVDRQGRAWTALYAFERQPDGSWRISGCVLKRLDEVSWSVIPPVVHHLTEMDDANPEWQSGRPGSARLGGAPRGG